MKKKFTSAELLSVVSPKRAILLLSIPGMLCTAIQLVYNLTDTFFIGMLGDYNQLSALTLSLPVTWILSALVSIVFGGAPSFISRAMGKGKTNEVNFATSSIFYLTLFVSILLTILSLLFLDPILSLAGANGELLSMTREYTEIVLFGMCFASLSAALQGFLSAKGEVGAAAKASLLGALCNIILDPLFIFPMNMGLKGAALATVCGSIVSLLYSLLIVRKKGFSLHPKNFSPGKVMKKILPLGAATGAANILQSLSMMFINIFMAKYGSFLLAAVGIAIKAYSFAITLVSGFTGGTQPFIGFNFGANNYDRVKKGLLAAVIYALAISCAFSLVFALLPSEIIELFSRDKQVIAIGTSLIRLFAVSIPFMSIQLCAMIFLISTGRAAVAFFLNCVYQLFLFLPALILLDYFFGLQGVIYAQPMADVLYTICTVLLVIPLLKKLKSPPSHSEEVKQVKNLTLLK